jgi:hypothetical protein
MESFFDAIIGDPHDKEHVASNCCIPKQPDVMGVAHIKYFTPLYIIWDEQNFVAFLNNSMPC